MFQPNAFPVMFGDFSRGYMIVDTTNLAILRDPFSQASLSSVRYYARARVGGQVVLWLKLYASRKSQHKGGG